MALERGFLIGECYIPVLSKLPSKLRTQIIGAAFSKACGLKDFKLPSDPTGIISGIVDGISASAIEYDVNSSKSKKNEALRKWLQRHPDKTADDWARLCKSGNNVVQTVETTPQCQTTAMSTNVPMSQNVLGTIRDNADNLGQKGQNSVRTDRLIDRRTTTARTRGTKMPTLEEVVAGSEMIGIPVGCTRDEFRQLVAEVYQEMVEAGWMDSAGRRIGNWRTYLKKAVFEKKISGARAAVSSPTVGWNQEEI